MMCGAMYGLSESSVTKSTRRWKTSSSASPTASKLSIERAEGMKRTSASTSLSGRESPLATEPKMPRRTTPAERSRSTTGAMTGSNMVKRYAAAIGGQGAVGGEQDGGRNHGASDGAFRRLLNARLPTALPRLRARAARRPRRGCRETRRGSRWSATLPLPPPSRFAFPSSPA